jgi:hypothetical protein
MNYKVFLHYQLLIIDYLFIFIFIFIYVILPHPFRNYLYSKNNNGRLYVLFQLVLYSHGTGFWMLLWWMIQDYTNFYLLSIIDEL